MTDQPRRKTHIDDPDYLRRWFQLSGHPFLVFKVADILDLTRPDQDLMVSLVLDLEPSQAPPTLGPEFYGAEAAARRSAIQGLGFRGYIKFDVEALGMMTMETIEQLQIFFDRYRQVRSEKFEPSTWEHCKCTANGARLAVKGCRKCSGGGKIWTLHEMSELESALAEGKTWDEIDAN